MDPGDQQVENNAMMSTIFSVILKLKAYISNRPYMAQLLMGMIGLMKGMMVDMYKSICMIVD